MRRSTRFRDQIGLATARSADELRLAKLGFLGMIASSPPSTGASGAAGDPAPCAGLPGVQPEAAKGREAKTSHRRFDVGAIYFPASSPTSPYARYPIRSL